MRNTRIISRSQVCPVNLYSVKEHLGIYHEEKDHNLNLLMNAATKMAEKFTGQIFHVGGDTYEQVLDSFASPVELDWAPVSGVSCVMYYDISGANQTLSTDLWELQDWKTPSSVLFNELTPTTTTGRSDAVRIRYVAGYAKAGDVPQDVKAAILLITQYLYDNPGDGVRNMPTASEYILRNYKVH
jgi:uncharacterized phiE125 gp8 family phage protein